jgi:hypothetical protein
MSAVRWFAALVVAALACGGEASGEDEDAGGTSAATVSTGGAASTMTTMPPPSASAPVTSAEASGPPQTGSGGGIELFCPPEPEPEPDYVLGWEYIEGYHEIDEGTSVDIVMGWQGAFMVPLAITGAGFCVPVDPFDYDNVPQLDARIDVGDAWLPLTAVESFPVSFGPTADDPALHYAIIPMVLPDGLDPFELDGLSATLTSELRVRGGPTLTFDREVILQAQD